MASTYDQYFSNFTRPHSQELVKKLNINNDVTVLDLACGTGTITTELRKYISKKGKILAVDSSEQMLKEGKEKIDEKNVEFICGDMLEFLDECQENSFNYATCGWAIGYVSPLRLLKKIKRILKHCGKIGPRCAVVATQPIHYGLTRMGASFANFLGAQIEVFVDVDAAISWLESKK